MTRTEWPRKADAMRLAAVSAAVVALLGLSACSGGAEPETNESGFVGVKSDTLTIATWNLPYPGYFNGQTPDTAKEGFGWELAEAIANDAGVSNVEIVIRNFSATMAGLSDTYDMAAFASPTPERQKVGLFSQCIVPNESVAFLHKDTKVETLEDLKNLKWGVSQGSAPGAVVTEGVKPHTSPRSYNGMIALVPSLLTGQINAAAGSVSDFAPFFESEEYSDYHVAVQMSYDSPSTSNQCQALQLPFGSEDTVELVDATIDRLREEGKIDDWMSEYIVPAMGGVDLREIPLINITD